MKFKKFIKDIDLSALYLQTMRRKNFISSKKNIFLEQFKKLHNENLKYLNFDYKNALSISILPEPNFLFVSSKVKKNAIFSATIFNEGSRNYRSVHELKKKRNLNFFSSSGTRYFSDPDSTSSYPFQDGSFSYVEAIPTIAWVNDLEKFFSETFRLTKYNGLIGFGSFGLGTLENFFYYFNKRQKPVDLKNLNLIDMHDIGDICLSVGYKDPIVLSSTITLQYEDENLALIDITSFFGNPNKNRFKGLRGKDFRKLVLNSLNDCRTKRGLIELNIELIYGHAWKLKKNNLNTNKGEKKQNYKKIEFFKL